MSPAAPRASTGRVLVTGASRGIGRAVVEALLERGATVAASARLSGHLEPLCALAPERVRAVAADHASVAEVDALVPRAVEALGGLDALVLCAGVAKHAPWHAIHRADLETHLAVNFVAPVLLAQAFAAHMRAERREGAMVLVASTLALRPAERTLAYAASKAALVSAIRTLAAELAPHGIRVNAVAPGVVDTDMARSLRLDPEQAAPEGAALEARVASQLESLAALHPMGRLGKPAEVASAILHLLDAPFTTGAVLPVDGGLLAV